jgi:hypothetical protein
LVLLTIALGCASGNSNEQDSGASTFDTSTREDASTEDASTEDASTGPDAFVESLDAQALPDSGPIDPCLTENGGCDSLTICTNAEGVPTCGACPTGYSGDGASGCIDVDECVTDNGECDPLSSCTNTAGGRACGACPLGYSGTGLTGCLPLFAGITYFKASNTGAADQFGMSVALSADGSTLAVGAHGEDSPVGGDPTANTLGASGAVYVFRRSAAGTWTQEAHIKASNAGVNDFFGLSLALSGDGTVLAVGARRESSAARGVDGDGANDAAVDSGAVYVFRRSDDASWAQEAYIKASNTEAGDWFGWPLALSADGLSLAVGAVYEDSDARGIDGDQTSNAAADSGAVYVFRQDGSGIWAQEAYVKASNTGADDWFGMSVALSADGSTLAVGAHQEDSGARRINGDSMYNGAPNSGAVYVFQRSDGAWTQEAYVKTSNSDTGDQFGVSVALSADGSTLAAGAILEDSAARGIGGDPTSNAATDTGAAYVFRRTTRGTWTQDAYIKASNGDNQDQFGRSLALSADGLSLAISAFFEDSAARGVGGDETSNATADSGAVYVFDRGGGSWAQEAYVKASNGDVNDRFAFSIALSADGVTLAAGAYFEDSAARGMDGDQTSNTAADSGAVYVYR